VVLHLDFLSKYLLTRIISHVHSTYHAHHSNTSTVSVLWLSITIKL